MLQSGILAPGDELASITELSAPQGAASQLLAGGFELRNTTARLGHSGGGATTLRHYADPVPEWTAGLLPTSRN